MEAVTVKLSEFKGEDTVAKISAAMGFLREHPGATLIIEPGEYSITTERARQIQDECMRGVYGPQPEPTMFNPKFTYSRVLDFAYQKNTTVIADGARFIVDGFLEPVSMRYCEGCTLVGLTVDTLRKPYSRGKIFDCRGVGTNDASFLVKFEDEYPVYPGTPMGLRNFYLDEEVNRLEYDGMPYQEYEMVAPQTFRFYGRGLPKNLDGKDYYVWHTYHFRPSLLIDWSKNVTVRNYTVNSHPGMGILGNRSENILIEGYKDVPCEGSWVATNTDATHFTACKGDLILRGCTFIGEGDDSINVHGYYHTIKTHAGCDCTTTVLAPTGTHTQTLDYPDVGDRMELSRMDTLETVDTYKVLAVTPRPEAWESDIILDHELPESTEGLLLFDIDRMPALVYENNVDKDHFARGTILKGRSSILRGNRFENVMSTAVCAFSEAGWHEGTSVQNLTVEDNVIVNCCYLGTTHSCVGIDIGAACEKAPAAPINKNVVIRNNLIKCDYDSACAISIGYTDGVVVENNRFEGKFENKLRHALCTNVKSDI